MTTISRQDSDMSRYQELKGILEAGRYFKIVCGAGNEDPEEVRRLTMVYALAGACCIDVSANVEVVRGAVSGLDEAGALASRLGKELRGRPFINVSVGLKGDPHVRKARIDPHLCILCGDCLEHCPQEAISPELVIHEARCIGCGDCVEVCRFEAIQFYDKRADLAVILPECLASGVETMELHAVSIDDKAVLADWGLLNALLPDNFISMCLDRSLLSNAHLLERIRQARQITGERMIVQADGIPMSGGSDDFNTTLQAIAVADIVQKSGLPVMLLASGGTNSRTRELARLCGVRVHGVAVGTFARKLVKPLVSRSDFEGNLELIGQAVDIAEGLVRANVESR